MSYSEAAFHRAADGRWFAASLGRASSALAAAVEHAIHVAASAPDDPRFRYENEREAAERQVVWDKGRRFELLSRLRAHWI
jgi:hypothetical protein